MTERLYKYENLVKDIEGYKKEFPHIPVFSIGRSLEGRKLFVIKVGTGAKRIFFNGAHHGTETITSKILIKFARELSEASPKWDASIYIMPMVNPDGAEIASKGVYWQANGRGVDLNHNYDALWDISKHREAEYGITCPGPTRYGGDAPESEAETRAIANFTRQNPFDLALCLHSQGEVIYYDFCGVVPKGTEEYLRRFEKVSNYKRDIPQGIACFGGYKDWFIKKYKKPAFTIEVGRGENPLPLSEFDDIYNEVKPILFEAIKLKMGN